jgi:hypothetical protein
MRELIRAEFLALQAEKATVTDAVAEVVTDTLARDLPGLVRQLVEGLALEALGLPVTDTNGDDTDTDDDITDTDGGVTDIESCDVEPEPRQVGRPRGVMGQRIVALLNEHPEGLSAEQIRAFLQPERPLGRYAPKPAEARAGTHTREGERHAVFCGLGGEAFDPSLT